MAQFATIRKLPTPELHAWALDFPQASTAARIGERGLYVQGWALGKADATSMELVVRTGEGEDAQYKNIAFSNARPDVISRVLGETPAGHARLRCGFIAHLDPVPSEFALGVSVDGQTTWLCEVRLECTPAQRQEVPGAQVIQGTDGWLYLDNDTNRSVDQYRGRLLLDKEGLACWANYLDACGGIARSVNARHAVLVAASKEQVLPEYYPHAKGACTPLEQVLGIARMEHALVDSAALLAKRADKEQCFIKTDTHWTDRGAMHIALALLERLGLDIEAACHRWSDDVYYTMAFAGDLGIKLQPASTAPTEFLQAPPVQRDAEFDNHLPNIGRVLIFRHEQALWEKTLLLFGASSSYPLLKYLKRIFGRVVFVHSAGNVDETIVEHEQPDYLVMQTTARFMITPPTTSFALRGAVEEKMRNADTQVRERALESGELASQYGINLPYCQMLYPNSHPIRTKSV